MHRTGDAQAVGDTAGSERDTAEGATPTVGEMARSPEGGEEASVGERVGAVRDNITDEEGQESALYDGQQAAALVVDDGTGGGIAGT